MQHAKFRLYNEKQERNIQFRSSGPGFIQGIFEFILVPDFRKNKQENSEILTYGK